MNFYWLDVENLNNFHKLHKFRDFLDKYFEILNEKLKNSNERQFLGVN